jgi:hypothetical protein
MRQYAPLSRWADHRETHGRSRNTDVEGKRMIRALEAAGLAWLMFNGALCVPMIRRRTDGLQSPGSLWPRRSVWIPCQTLRLSTFSNIKSSLHTFDRAG